MKPTQVVSLEGDPTEIPPTRIDDVSAVPTEPVVIQLPEQNDDMSLNAAVTLQEYLCDPHWDPYSSQQSWWEWVNACSHPGQPGYQFHQFEYTISDGDGWLASVPDPSAYGLNPVGVPAGTISIATTVPVGFGDPVVRCAHSSYTPILNPPPEEAQLWTTGSTIDLELNVGDVMLCDFYHVPDPQHSNAVSVSGRLCQPEVTPGLQLSDYLAACGMGHDGATVTLMLWNTGVEYGNTVDGEVRFDDVALGHVWLTVADQGTSPVGVFCGMTESTGGGIQHPASQVIANGQIESFMELPGTELGCLWFSVPDA
jgi:hypothetical protein